MGRTSCVASRLALAAALPWSVGCAQLLGIDETSGRTNALEIKRVSLGAKVVTSPMSLEGLSADYLVEQPGTALGYERVAATPHDDGTWTVPLPDPVPVEFTLPDVPTPFRRLFALPSNRITTQFAPLEHPDPEPAPDGAQYTLTVHLDAGIVSEQFYTVTVGSWARRQFAVAEIPMTDPPATTIGPVTFGLTPADSTSGRPQIDRLTRADAFLVLRYASDTLTGVAEAAPFDQTGSDTLDLTMAPVMPDKTLSVTFDTAAIDMRLGTARPVAAGALAGEWQVTASPGYFLASLSGVVLAKKTFDATAPGVTATYANPFVARDWRTVFFLRTVKNRSYPVPGADPADIPIAVTLTAGMQQTIDPDAGTPLNMPAGLPTRIRLNGVDLSTDGLSIAQPTGFIDVSFVTDQPVSPSATFYQLELSELLPIANMPAFERRLLFRATADAPSFQIPPDLFTAGHRYVVRAFSTLGDFPSFATGDLSDRNLPLAQSFLDGGVFTVTP